MNEVVLFFVFCNFENVDIFSIVYVIFVDKECDFFFIYINDINVFFELIIVLKVK